MIDSRLIVLRGGPYDGKEVPDVGQDVICHHVLTLAGGRAWYRRAKGPAAEVMVYDYAGTRNEDGTWTPAAEKSGT